jgi:ADP-ribose pyrophosphatase YjhB (NUDIX family)
MTEAVPKSQSSIPAAAPAGGDDVLTYPRRPQIGVGVVVWRGDEFLLIRRGKPPRYGQWSIPGGRQELGETTRETAVREIKEETDLEIDLVGLVDVYDAIRVDTNGSIASHFTLIDYTARWVSGDAVAGDDAIGVGWFTLDDLPELKLWKETEHVIRASRRLIDGTLTR